MDTILFLRGGEEKMTAKWIVYDEDEEYVRVFETKEQAIEDVKSAITDGEDVSSTKIARVEDEYEISMDIQLKPVLK